jgi:hypothetical protein
MVAVHRSGRLLALIAAAATLAAGCNDSTGLADKLYDDTSKLDAGGSDSDHSGAGHAGGGDAMHDGGGHMTPSEICEPAVSSDARRARGRVHHGSV